MLKMGGGARRSLGKVLRVGGGGGLIGALEGLENGGRGS